MPLFEEVDGSTVPVNVARKAVAATRRFLDAGDFNLGSKAVIVHVQWFKVADIYTSRTHYAWWDATLRRLRTGYHEVDYRDRSN